MKSVMPALHLHRHHHLKEQDHEGKKPSNYTVCEVIFVLKVAWNVLVASVHEKRKPFACQQCYTCHMSSVHEGKKPFKCSICDM